KAETARSSALSISLSVCGSKRLINSPVAGLIDAMAMRVIYIMPQSEGSELQGKRSRLLIWKGGSQECLPYKLAAAAMITSASLLESKRDRANRTRIGRATPATPPELHLPES